MGVLRMRGTMHMGEKCTRLVDVQWGDGVGGIILVFASIYTRERERVHIY